MTVVKNDNVTSNQVCIGCENCVTPAHTAGGGLSRGCQDLSSHLPQLPPPSTACNWSRGKYTKALGVTVLTGASLSSAHFFFYFLFFGHYSEEIQTNGSCLWGRRTSCKGKRRLKSEKRGAGFSVPFLLQLCCVQTIVFHPYGETLKRKHNHLAETQLPLPAAPDVVSRAPIHTQIRCDSV